MPVVMGSVSSRIFSPLGWLRSREELIGFVVEVEIEKYLPVTVPP